MIELRASPSRRRMAGRAQGWKTGRRVLRVGGLIKIRDVTTGAIGRSAGKLAAQVALIATHTYVSTGKWELSRRTVIEYRARP